MKTLEQEKPEAAGGSPVMKALRSSTFSLILVELIIFAFFWKLIPGGRFAMWTSLELLIRTGSIVYLTAVGMTFVIVSGGIDLSVGSVVAFSGMLIAVLLTAHFSVFLSVLGGILGGTAWGFLNGFLITRLKVGPFIVTLGAYSAVRAIALGLGHQSTVYPPNTILPLLMQSVPRFAPPFAATGVWIAVALTVLFGLTLRYTRFGRWVVAVGSNESAARLCGIPVERVQIIVYTISGFMAGVGGLLMFSQLNIGNGQAATGLELSAIAAAVIGGCSLLGGEGSVFGTVLGATIMQTISSGTTQLGMQDWVQQLVTGVIIVLAVGVDRWRARRSLRVN